MARKIENAAVYMVDSSKKYELNVPQLFADLQMSPGTPVQHLKAIEVLSELLTGIAIRAMQINDPKIIEILKRMKFIQNISKESEK